MNHASAIAPAAQNHSVLPPCPLNASRPELLQALAEGRNLVLSALPGAGKSSRVPLWLLDQPWLAGQRILLLEPRRVAARALARYMSFAPPSSTGSTKARKRDRPPPATAAWAP